jgi:hypothetical protein
VDNFFEVDGEINVDRIMELIKHRKKNRVSLVHESNNSDQSFEDLDWKIKEVEENQNPIPVPLNTRFRFLKRMIGKLIRTYTRKQVHFNQSISSYLTLDLNHLRNLNTGIVELNKKTDSINEALKEMLTKKEYYDDLSMNLEVISNKLSLELSTNINEISSKLLNQEQQMENIINDELNNWTSLIDERFQNINSWNLLLDTRIKGIEEWMPSISEWLKLVSNNTERIDSYQDRVRKELFAELKFSGGSYNHIEQKQVENKIINVEKVNMAMQLDAMRLNLGCGTLAISEYINVDFREMEGVDIIADVRKIEFPNESVTEIYSAHLIEHFTEEELKRLVLPHWFSLLKSSGVIRLICPNWEVMLSEYSNGNITFDELKEVTFGSQEYDGNNHYNMFSPESLTKVLHEIGFKDISIIDSDRKNGICLEMEIRGVK